VYNKLMNRKFFLSIGLLLFTVVCTSSLSSFPLLLSILLIVIALIKHRIYPIKQEFIWFVLMGLGGGVTEIIIVNSSHSWSYSNTQLFGIPIWIPLFWGVISTAVIVAYDGLTRT
jgi:hypothetical protein